MSKTPRTDAVRCYPLLDNGEFRPIAFCRDLELELTAANAELAELRKDKARLDVLQNYSYRFTVTNRGKTVANSLLRELLDEVIGEQEGGEG